MIGFVKVALPKQELAVMAQLMIRAEEEKKRQARERFLLAALVVGAGAASFAGSYWLSRRRR